MAETVRAAPVTPPRLLNTAMGLMLRTPGLQRVAGRGTALVTFTGRKSGDTYTTPVTYTRFDGRVLLTAHQSRQWWRNLETNPEVRLRLAGTEVTGTARVLRGEEALPDLIAYYQAQRTVTRAAGIDRDLNGNVFADQVAAHLPDTVVISIVLA